MSEAIPNGRLKRVVWAGAVAGAIVAVLTLFGGWLWPWAEAIVHHLDTIMWVNQVRAEQPSLARDVGMLNEYLNGVPDRDRRVAAVEGAVADMKLTADEIDRKLAEQEGELRVHRQMLEMLLRDRGIAPPTRRPMQKEGP